MTTVTHETAIEIRTNVSWDEYVKARDSDEEGPRMTFDNGTLIVMSPQYIHEGGAELLSAIVRAVAEAFAVDFASARSTTFRRAGNGPQIGSGKEPDASFYLGANERRIRGKTTIDLDVDPPPDLAIEVENKGYSDYALPVYAGLRVPEVWRYDARGRNLWFGRLVGEAYESIDRSVCLPSLTPGLVLQAIETFELGMGERLWLGWLRAWAQSLAEGRAD